MGPYGTRGCTSGKRLPYEEAGKATAESLLSALPHNGTHKVWVCYETILSLFSARVPQRAQCDVSIFQSGLWTDTVSDR